MAPQIITAPRASTLIYGFANGGPRGVWLLPANVCPAIPCALMQAQIIFEFIDIDSKSLCMDISKATQRIQDAKKIDVTGVVYVHSYGFSPTAEKDLKELRACLREDAIVIDDRCLCVPQIDFEGLESFGANAVVFSTGYSKVVDLGYGGYGLLFTDINYVPPTVKPGNNVYKEMMNLYKAAINNNLTLDVNLYNDESMGYWVPTGKGPRWDDLKEGVTEVLPRVMAHKSIINSLYKDKLGGLNPIDDQYQNWRFNIRIKNPKEVLTSLSKAGLFASNHYYPSSSLWGDESAPNSKELHCRMLNLFNDFNFSISQAEQAVDIILKVAIKEKT